MRVIYGRIAPGWCHELHIRADGVGDGLLGGHPPRGASPRGVTKNTRFFATLPLNQTLDVSLFLHFDFDAMWDARGVVQTEQTLIEVVTHERAETRNRSEWRSELPAMSLEIGPQVRDEARDGGGPLPHHKLGGCPRLVWEREETVSELSTLAAGGGKLFAQFAFPSSSDAIVDGDWPFGDGLFHAFMGPGGSKWWFLWDS